MTLPQNAAGEYGYRMLCLHCGGSIRGDEGEPESRVRSFSYGPNETDTLVTTVAMVCPDCVDVDMLSLRRKMYQVIFQVHEQADSPIKIGQI